MCLCKDVSWGESRRASATLCHVADIFPLQAVSKCYLPCLKCSLPVFSLRPKCSLPASGPFSAVVSRPPVMAVRYER